MVDVKASTTARDIGAANVAPMSLFGEYALIVAGRQAILRQLTIPQVPALQFVARGLRVVLRLSLFRVGREPSPVVLAVARSAVRRVAARSLAATLDAINILRHVFRPAAWCASGVRLPVGADVCRFAAVGAVAPARLAYTSSTVDRARTPAPDTWLAVWFGHTPNLPYECGVWKMAKVMPKCR